MLSRQNGSSAFALDQPRGTGSETRTKSMTCSRRCWSCDRFGITDSIERSADCARSIGLSHER
jgi:hypothetical protein